MMKTKTKVAKKPLACLAVLALATGVFGVCSLSSANSKIAANAAPSTAIDFTSEDANATGIGSELVTNVDTDGNGAIDAASAWKIDLTQKYGAITFNTPIDLTGAKGIQLRVYLHWSPDALTAEDTLCIHKDAITDQAGAGSIWAFWKGVDANQPDRPLVQDEWITFTITDHFPLESLSKLSIVPSTSKTVAAGTLYEDAYMLVDSVTVIKDGDTVNGANVVTEFGADQVSHAGQGWRSDLVVAGDGCSHGATTAWKAKAQPGVVSVSFPEVNLNALYGTNLKGLQIRMYAHLGEITGDTNIEVQLNGTTMGHWASEASGLFDTTRPIVQDQWITYTIAENFSLASLSKFGFNFPGSGISYHNDAYILVDKITTIKDSEALGENVVTEFAADQISQSGKGWRTDLLVDADTDGDGVVDAENAWRLKPCASGSVSASSSITFANAIDLTDVAYLQFRIYLHWGPITGANPTIALYMNSVTEANTLCWWSGDQADRLIFQDQWVTLTITADQLAKVKAANNNSMSTLYVNTYAAGVQSYNDAYFLVDKIVGLPAAAQKDSNVIMDFSPAEIDNTNKGWRTDLLSDVDTNGDGVIDAKNAYRLHYAQSAGTYPMFDLANPIDLTNVKSLHLRVYIHWGEIKEGGWAAILLKTKNGGSEQDFIYLASDDKLVQDQWMDIYVDEENVAKQIQQCKTILATKMGETNVNVYDDAYILFDVMYENKYEVTFNTESGTQTVTYSEGQKVTPPESDKEGYSISWYTDSACTQAYDFNTEVKGNLNLYAKYVVIENSDALVEFTSKEVTAVNSTLETMVDADGDGVVDAISAWKFKPSASGWASSSVNFANAIDLTDVAYLQFRIYLHWGPITGDNPSIAFYMNSTAEANTMCWWSGDQADRLIFQDEWITLTITADQLAQVKAATANSMSSLYINTYAAGVQSYDDAYFLVDKVVGLPAAKDELGENVLTEFAANEINNTSKGWRTDIVTDMNDISNGAENGWRLKPSASGWASSSITFANPIDLTNVAYLQFRIYLHWGQITGENPTIALYMNSATEANTMCWWSGDQADRLIFQDQWVTLTITADQLAKVKAANNNSMSTLYVNTYVAGVESHADSYILLDKIVGLPATAQKDSNVITDFSPAEIDNTSKGWRTDLLSDVDTNGDGVIDAKNAYRLNYGTAAGTYPMFDLANPIDLTNVKSLNLRVYIHWGEIKEGGWAAILLKTKNGGSEQDFIYLASDGKLVQDQWMDIYVDEENVAKQIQQCKTILATKMGETNVNVYDDAYILFDVMYENKYEVTFNAESGAQTVTYSEGQKVSALESDKAGHSVAWYVDEARTQAYDFNAVVTGNMTLYPKYTMYTYTVTFDHPEGYTDKSVTVDWNTSVSETCDEAACQQTGKYVAWFIDAAYTQAFDFSTKITENTVIYGKYTSNLYSVTFAHGSNFGGNVVQNVEHGSLASAPASTSEAYNVAWYADEACTVAFDFNAPITGNVTVYAKYTIKTFTVTFNHGGDITSDVVENVEYGSKVTAKEGKKTGYTVAWYADEACEQAFDFENTEIKANTTIYAKYSPIPYTVTFMDGENKVKDVTVNYDAKVAMEESNREGYTVVWYTDAACTNAYDFNTAITGNLTLYGGYTIKTFTVTFNHEGAATEAVVVNYGETVAEAASKKEGYSVKWYVDAEHTERFDFDAPVKADYQLYPVYKINVYTVTFNFDESVTTAKVEYGQTVTAPAAANKAGYTVAWYTDEAWTQAYDFNAVVKSNLTLYAKYTVITYTVTVNVEGVETTVTVNYGEKMTAPEADKEGYTVAWYTDAACTQAYDFNAVVNSNLTLYAKYTIITYTVTVNVEGVETTVTVNYGEKMTAPEADKEGYTVAWYTDEACTVEFDFDTVITEDLTIYAKYTKIDNGDSSNSDSSDVDSSSSEADSSSAGAGININDLLGGCSGIVGTGAALSAGVLAAAAGAILLRKKKDDDEK